MIDVLVDTGVDQAFKPPQGIDAAIKAACIVAGLPLQEPELCIRFTTDVEIRSLNRQWRDKDTVTDVLSFPMQEVPVELSESLGDIALAVPFIGREAARLGLAVDAHILHLIIHATLHLLGFDHIGDMDASRMQALETEAMQGLSLHRPYPAQEHAGSVLHEFGSDMNRDQT